jgi:hypothetical protein
MTKDTDYQKEVEAVAHWIDLTPEDGKEIAKFVENDLPQNGEEFDRAWDKWEGIYRKGKAMEYIRELEKEIEALTK